MTGVKLSDLADLPVGVGENDRPLNETQRKEVIELLHGYWGSQQVKSMAEEAAGTMFRIKMEEDIRSLLLQGVQNDPAKMVAEMFRSSGMIVKTEASKVFDAIVADHLKDEDSGVPAAIRQYVADHLPMLVQRAVTEIVTAMVIDFLKSGASSLAGANHEMIRNAFMNARMSPGY